MKTSDFYYDLPKELIAQTPAPVRSESRLLIYTRGDGSITDGVFTDIIDHLHPGDVLVRNNTRVIPARLIGHRPETGGPMEFLLLSRLEGDTWECLCKPAKRAKVGTVYEVTPELSVRVLGDAPMDGGKRVELLYEGIFEEVLDRAGQMPLPPYITERLADKERYQTVYAVTRGSAAAPTAGLHFTQELLQQIADKGVKIVDVLLHVGLGTFRPVSEENIEDHQMHEEFYRVTEEAAKAHVGERLHRRRRGSPRQRLYRHLHHPRLPLQGRGCPHHQLPPAGKHPAHAGLRLRGPGGGTASLRPRRRGALSLLQLWRCLFI